MGMLRDDGDEERAGLDLLADQLIPGITATQLALVEPDFEACRPEGFADTTGCLSVLRGVADENGVRSVAQGAQPPSTMSRLPLCARMVADAQGLGNWT